MWFPPLFKERHEIQFLGQKTPRLTADLVDHRGLGPITLIEYRLKGGRRGREREVRWSVARGWKAWRNLVKGHVRLIRAVFDVVYRSNVCALKRLVWSLLQGGGIVQGDFNRACDQFEFRDHYCSNICETNFLSWLNLHFREVIPLSWLLEICENRTTRGRWSRGNGVAKSIYNLPHRRESAV